MRYQAYSDFGFSDSLDELVSEFEDHFKTDLAENLSEIEQRFRNKDFEKISPLI